MVDDVFLFFRKLRLAIKRERIIVPAQRCFCEKANDKVGAF